MKFHILLLSNIQDDFMDLTDRSTMGSDWLRKDLNEYHRLSSEMEETLKKPIAQMVDLVKRAPSL